MIVLTRRRARAARDAAARRLGDLIDELEPGDGMDPAVAAQHATFIALDTAVRSARWWARTVPRPLTEQSPAVSAHKQPVTR